MNAKGTPMQHNLTLLTALLLAVPTALHAVEKSPSEHASQPRVFNVVDYGARGDDAQDNTAAFSACLKAILEAGGGRMYLPNGVYRGRIIIPPVAKPTPSWITVEIFGESEPAAVFGTLGNFPLQNRGTIVKSLATEGAAVISATRPPKGQDLYGGFSAVYVVIRNLDVRTYDNPAIGGIDLANAMQCRLENVFINTGVYSVQASKPTHNSKGLVTPRNNNAALTLLRNVAVTGYHTGIVVNEHTDGDSIELDANIHGLEFPFAHHASRFGRVCAQNCTHTITVTGAHGFSIQQLDIERATPKVSKPSNAWQNAEDEVNDPGNLGIADINYWVVIGGVGARDVFTKNGGAQIRARRIGSAPNETKTRNEAKP
jgi:hypothetical protein